MATIKFANLVLSFLLELGALAAFSFWGFHAGATFPWKIVLAISAPLLAAVLWGIFAAPRAVRPLPEPWHLLFALTFFTVAATALYASGQQRLGVVFALVVGVNEALAYTWGQTAAGPR